MEPYIIIFCLLAGLAIVELYVEDRPVKIAIGLICVVILTVFAGIRWETANDWGNYLDNYQFGTSLRYNADEYEIGYRTFVVACNAIGLSYTGFLLLSALISNAGFVYVFARLGPVAVLTLMFYGSYYLGYIGTQRQTLATAFACIGLLAIYDRRRLAACMLILVGMSFHVGAAVCFAAFVTPRRSLSLPLFVTIGTVVGAVALLAQSNLYTFASGVTSDGFIVSKVLKYIVEQGAGTESLGNIALASLKRAVLAVFFAVVCRDRFPSINNYILNLYLLSVVLFFLFVGAIPILALRIGGYFTIFENYLIYMAIVRFSRQYWREAFLSAGMILCSARLYWSIVSAEKLYLIPYKSLYTYTDHYRFHY